MARQHGKRVLHLLVIFTDKEFKSGVGGGAKGRDGLMSPPRRLERWHALLRTYCADFSMLFCISTFILLHLITATATGCFHVLAILNESAMSI